MSAAALRELFDIELHAPVTMTDCDELRRMAVARFHPTSVEVVLRGTPDRKHDGEHRVVVRVDDVCVELPVSV